MTTDRAAFEAALGEYAMSFRSSTNLTYDEAVARRSDLLAIYDAIVADLDREWNKATALAGESATLRAEVATLTAECQRREMAEAEALALVTAHEGAIERLTVENGRLVAALRWVSGTEYKHALADNFGIIDEATP